MRPARASAEAVCTMVLDTSLSARLRAGNLVCTCRRRQRSHALRDGLAPLSVWQTALPAPVRPEKQIPERIAQTVGDLALHQVVAAVVDYVTALAEAAQVAHPVVARVAVQMRRRQ